MPEGWRLWTNAAVWKRSTPASTSFAKSSRRSRTTKLLQEVLEFLSEQEELNEQVAKLRETHEMSLKCLRRDVLDRQQAPVEDPTRSCAGCRGIARGGKPRVVASGLRRGFLGDPVI